MEHCVQNGETDTATNIGDNTDFESCAGTAIRSWCAVTKPQT